MEKKIGVLLIQGLGNSKVKEARKIQQQLLRELDRIEPGFSDKIIFKDVDYHTSIQYNQEKLWKRMAIHGLRWSRMRRFCLHYLSDATSYQHDPSKHPNTYQEIHQKILDSLRFINNVAGEEGFIPVVLAGSLGCMIINNYIWDAQKHKYLFDRTNARMANPHAFESLENLELMLTWGCNIPMFVSSLKQVSPIAAPVKSEEFEWFNYFDRDDVLGWPLRPLGVEYASRVTEDIPFNVGVSPLGHTKYWSRPNRMARRTARRIITMYQRYLSRTGSTRIAA